MQTGCQLPSTAVSRRYMAAEQTPNAIPLASGFVRWEPGEKPDFDGGALPLSRRNPNYMDCVDGLVGRMHRSTTARREKRTAKECRRDPGSPADRLFVSRARQSFARIFSAWFVLGATLPMAVRN